MRFWKRSIRQDDRSHRDATRVRGPNRKRRLQLENLEERTLLSTYTLSESYVNGISTVSETINNTTTLYSKPSSPFVVNTGSGSNTVNIRNTSAGIAITEIGGNNTVNVGEGSGNFGLVVLWAAVNIQNPASPYTLNVNDSADMTAQDPDAQHLQFGRRELGLDHRAGGGDQLRVLRQQQREHHDRPCPRHRQRPGHRRDD